MPKILIGEIQKSQTIKTLWPFIREYGYSETYKMIRAIFRGQDYKAKTGTSDAIIGEKVNTKQSKTSEVPGQIVVDKDTIVSDGPESIWLDVLDRELKRITGR